MTLLEAKGLSKRFERAGQAVHALADFDLQLQPGELVGLLGPNGAGKSTLLRILSGLCAADAGVMRWQGQGLRGQAHLGRVGLLMEGRGALNERLSSWENARYFCGLREARFDAAHCRQLAEQLDLADLHAPVRLLSTGNKLRAGLLLALVHRPALLLLDEPTLGLDLFGVDRLRAVVRTALAEGCAVLVSSHDLALVESLAERVVCIAGGRKRFDGPRAAFVPQGQSYALRWQDPERLAPDSGAEALGEGWWQRHLPDHAALCAWLQHQAPLLPRLSGLQVQPLTLALRYRRLLEEVQ